MLPVVVGLCAVGMLRLQSGTKLWLLSVQVRVVPGLKMPPNVVLPPGIRCDGLTFAARLLTLAPCRYLPTLTFNAVLPLPKTSIAAPRRGVMSL